jgi:hypothetical protein
VPAGLERTSDRGRHLYLAVAVLIVLMVLRNQAIIAKDLLEQFPISGRCGLNWHFLTQIGRV